jgi:large repetitive protein
MKNLIRIWLAVFFLSAPTFSKAAVYTVNTEADMYFPTPGVVSLRDAISMANQNPGLDLINIPAGHYILNKLGPDEDNNVSGDLDIHDSVYLVGEGMHTTIIDADYIDRVLDIHNSTEPITVLLVNLTIKNGQTLSSFADRKGAGIRNYGNLFLYNVAIIGNTASSDGIGGGISNNGSLTITNSTIANNSADRGGGIFNAGASELSLKQSSISHNYAHAGGALNLYGNFQLENSTIHANRTVTAGNVILAENSAGSITFCTIAGNTILNPGYTAGIFSNTDSLFTLSNTIISGNIVKFDSSIGNCNFYSSTPTLAKYNLEDADTCALSPVANLINTDPLLKPYGDYGGSTYTLALSSASPAIDGVKEAVDISSDQRGKPRPIGKFADIGAFEYKGTLCFPIRALNGKNVIICM